MPSLLAFDTSTEAMSIALSTSAGEWLHEGEGGAMASARLVPEVLALLARAGCTLEGLDAIGFGRGPGAFTGLRTACPVLAIDSLMLVAEDALVDASAGADCWVVMDARMDEIYAGRYRREPGGWRTLVEPLLLGVHALNARLRAEPAGTLAGSALEAFGDRLQGGAARRVPLPQSRAAALARLARQQWDAGRSLDAALALPVYVRDNVALTTAEREAVREAKAVS